MLGKRLANVKQSVSKLSSDLANQMGVPTWRVTEIEEDRGKPITVDELHSYVRACGGHLEITAEINHRVITIF
ncbi:MAG: hypothetical protein JO287_20070 [Pseudonocardiales bacterium]|nr:hypothetical protein [Pseudonocardiales bacterium]